MNAQTPHNDLDKHSQDKPERLAAPGKKLLGEKSPIQLDEYFHAARTENISLFTEQSMHDLVRNADSRPRNRAFGRLRNAIQHSPLLTIALASVICVVVGFGIAEIADYLADRAKETERTLHNTIQDDRTNNVGTREQSFSDAESSLLSTNNHRSKSDAEAAHFFGKRRTKHDTTSLQTSNEREQMFPVFAGLPPQRTSRLPSVHFLELNAEEFQRLGVTISGKNTVEILRRLPQKDSSKPALIASFSFRGESLRQPQQPYYTNEQKAAPVITTAENVHRTIPIGIRPYILTDTIGRTLPIFPTAESFSELPDAHDPTQQAWQLLFRGYDSRKHNDTTSSLIGIRLQSAPGLYSELRNIVFWFRATPALIELLPSRLREQMHNELRVAALSQRLAQQRKDSYTDNDKTQSAIVSPITAYYLAQTQTFVPHVMTLGSSILRTRLHIPFRVTFFLHEARSLRISLHNVSGSLVQECSSVPTALGQQTSVLTVRTLPSGVYFLVFRTDQNETALQYLFVE